MMSEGSIRLLLGVAVVLTLVALAFGLWVHWPWPHAEHERLEPGFRVLIWVGDACTLLWFVWSGVHHGLLGQPLPESPSKDSERRYLLHTLAGAFAIDLVVSGITARHEETGRERAVSVRGEIAGGRPTV